MITDYLYLLGVLGLIPGFLYIYFKRPDLQRRMLVIGVVSGLVGVLSEYVFMRDYWQPPLIFRFGSFGGPEDFIFGFITGSVGSVLYEFFMKRRVRKGPHHHYWIIPVMFISEYICVRYGMAYGLNSIYASGLGLIVPAVIISIIRLDLIKDAIFSGVVYAALLVAYENMVLVFNPSYLQDYFLLHGQVRMVGNTALTELIWGLMAGAMFGVFYEFFAGKRHYKMAQTKNSKHTPGRKKTAPRKPRLRTASR